MDPLSDILSLLKPAEFGFRGLDAGGAWALAFGPSPGLNCLAIDKGDCWLRLSGGGGAVRLGAGDLVLVSGDAGFELYGQEGAPALDAVSFLSATPPGGVARLNGGGACSGVGGYFEFAGPRTDLLLLSFPDIIHINVQDSGAALRVSIDRIMAELRDPRMGSALIAQHVVQTLLIEALRHHLANPRTDGKGWLRGLADRRIAAALAALHADPARPWSLKDLASAAGMSRSSFAQYFRATTGEPVMIYLTRWRMLLAADRLERAGAAISDVASSVGYGSESAFGAAFKRVLGQSPRRFVQGR